MKRIATILLTLSLLVPGLPCSAQHQAEAFVAAGISFATKKYSTATYKPLPLLSGGISYYRSFSDHVALKTGIGYQFQAVRYIGQPAPDTSEQAIVANGTTRLHMISVPLQLAFFIQGREHRYWRSSIGMNYGFVVYARSKGTTAISDSNPVTAERSFDFSNYVGFSRSSDDNRKNDRTEIVGFIPSLRIDIGYQWHRNIFVGAFYQFNINDISSNAGSSKVHLHAAGLALSFSLTTSPSPVH